MRRALRASLRASLLALPVLLAVAPNAEAQRRGRDRDRDRDNPPRLRRERPQLSIEGAGLFAMPRGSALGRAGDGTGFDAMASIGAGVFSIGGGYQRAWHTRPLNDAHVIVDGAFLEPRLALPVAAGNFTPYLLGRASRLTRHAPATGTGSEEPEIKGTALGGGIGNLFWLADNVQLNTSLMWQDLRFDRALSVQGPGGTGRVSGGQWTIRAGVTIGFDNWGR